MRAAVEADEVVLVRERPDRDGRVRPRWCRGALLCGRQCAVHLLDKLGQLISWRGTVTGVRGYNVDRQLQQLFLVRPWAPPMVTGTTAMPQLAMDGYQLTFLRFFLAFLLCH